MVYSCKNVNMKYSYSKLIITNTLVVSWLFNCVSKETKPSLDVQNVNLKPNNLASMFFNTCNNFIDFKFCPPSFLNLCLFLSAIIIKTILKTLFYIGVQLVNNVVVSGGQQRYSALNIYVSTLPWTPFPSHPGCHITLSRVLCVKPFICLKFMANPSWPCLLKTLLFHFILPLFTSEFQCIFLIFLLPSYSFHPPFLFYSYFFPYLSSVI